MAKQFAGFIELAEYLQLSKKPAQMIGSHCVHK